MTDLQERIARFQNMVQADPDNEMAHFSLGTALQQAERFAEAAECFQRCLAVSPQMSKAYQLAGECMIKAGWEDRAVTVLRRGYEVAAARGDAIPRDAIAAMLTSIGREVPVVPGAGEDASAPAAAEPESGTFTCSLTGRPGHQLEKPPFRDGVGQWIYEHISAETWQTWIAQGTKVINELMLDFSREEDQKVYEQYMCEFLGIEPTLYEELQKSS